MKTLLMDAYEALDRLRDQRPEDPYEPELTQVVNRLFLYLGEEELRVLNARKLARQKEVKP